jgi:hypothetical protein
MDELSARRAEKIEELIEGMKGAPSVGVSVIVGGRVVPKLRMLDNGGSEVNLILDDRLMFPFPRDQVYQAAAITANALAIGAGYAHIEHCDKQPPFAPHAGRITLSAGEEGVGG